MERSTSRNLYLVGIALAIIATILLIAGGGVASATSTTNSDGSISTAGAGVGILVLVSFLVYAVSAILAAIAWIGALVKTARLGQWVWFILLLVINATMLVYIFAGPTQPANSSQMAR